MLRMMQSMAAASPNMIDPPLSVLRRALFRLSAMGGRYAPHLLLVGKFEHTQRYLQKSDSQPSRFTPNHPAESRRLTAIKHKIKLAGYFRGII
jgi:hypothetical protein